MPQLLIPQGKASADRRTLLTWRPSCRRSRKGRCRSSPANRTVKEKLNRRRAQMTQKASVDGRLFGFQLTNDLTSPKRLRAQGLRSHQTMVQMPSPDQDHR